MLKENLNNNPFGVPKNYFENLPTQVQERCLASNPKHVGLWTKLKPQMGFAVGFGMLAMVAYGGFSMLSPNNIGDTTSTINGMATQYNTSINKANSFAKKPFVSFVNNQILGKRTPSTSEGGVNEAVMSYLSSENITIDDILALE